MIPDHPAASSTFTRARIALYGTPSSLLIA
jgi:hypothetical protein